MPAFHAALVRLERCVSASAFASGKCRQLFNAPAAISGASLKQTGGLGTQKTRTTPAPCCGITAAAAAVHRPVIMSSGSATATEKIQNAEAAKRKTRIPPPPHPTCDLQMIIRLALDEDAGDAGDVTCLATIPEQSLTTGTFLAKEEGVLAGTVMAEMVLQEVDPALTVDWTLEDGDWVRRGQEFGVVKGPARSILLAERVVLNFMQRMSGIATATKAMADAASPARILETRKTAPGLRLVDKWAVLIGGGENHRMGLYDMVMIKDNHVAAAGGLQAAVEAARGYLIEKELDIPMEVETRTIEEVREAMVCLGEGRGRVTRLMLDNMVGRRADGSLDTSMLQEAVTIVGGRVETEASGNVTLQTVGDIGRTGVTFISSGSLTHSVKALDISFNIDTELAMAVSQRSLPM
eukprot:TRINITY_DN6710_c0_g1_i1.p1 TRINITY_DN6710_c0_g1~~TRINITY_DN6710_c0_g1_i1.p1  ORF type:complete len:409 (+),score=129.41 TRINITY_DN6710_c0_g1_i1:112-1338(+)